MANASEFAFQNEMIQHLVANGWLLGKPEKYNRESLDILAPYLLGCFSILSFIFNKEVIEILKGFNS